MNDDISTFLYFALSAKGGYYTSYGSITDNFIRAKLFKNKEEAVSFRQKHDPLHKIDESRLIAVSILLKETNQS